MVELLGGRVNVKTTPEGVDAWKIVYRGEEETLYQHFNALVVDNKLHIYLMERGSNVAGVGDSRPLYFQTLSLTEIDDENPAIVRTPDVIEQKEEPEETVRDIVFSVEAEDYDTNGANISYFDKTAANTGGSSYRNDEAVDIQAISTASNGHVVAIFEGEEWVKYTFEIEEAGEYDFILTAANRNRDDSTMDIEINGQVNSNFPIKRSFDWNVFEENIIENVTLNKGSNTVVLTQRKSQSSTLDKIEFARKSTLSTINFTKQNITVYPNPSNGVFNVTSNGQNLKYAFINLQGQLLQNGVVNQNKIDVSRFNSGIYFLELILEDKKIIKKVILK